MTAAEDVERQVAVAVVVAMEEAALLMPVQRVIGGVKVEDDLPRRCAVRLQEQPHKEILNRFAIERDLVIARWLRPAQLEPVEAPFHNPPDRDSTEIEVTDSRPPLFGRRLPLISVSTRRGDGHALV